MKGDLKTMKTQNLEKYAEGKISKLNKKWNLGSASYCTDIQDGKVRIYNGCDNDFYPTSKKQIDSWIAEANRIFKKA